MFTNEQCSAVGSFNLNTFTFYLIYELFMVQLEWHVNMEIYRYKERTFRSVLSEWFIEMFAAADMYLHRLNILNLVILIWATLYTLLLSVVLDSLQLWTVTYNASCAHFDQMLCESVKSDALTLPFVIFACLLDPKSVFDCITKL